MEITLETVDEYTRIIPRQGAMKVPVTVYSASGIRIEDDALKQIMDAACIDNEAVVIVTPDIHTGYGVPIGSILASPNILSPSAVGYDINCGMRLLTTQFSSKKYNPVPLARAIAGLIPLGEGKQNLTLTKKELKKVINGGLKHLNPVVRDTLSLSREELSLLDRDALSVEDEGSLEGSARDLPPRALERGLPQLGTLGGGNHFIEIQEVVEVYDKDHAAILGINKGRITIMIHSGSRGLGHETAGFFMKQAKEYMKSLKLVPPNSQLFYFAAETEQGKSYLRAMNGAANYAFANRQVMTLLTRKAVESVYGREQAIQVTTVYDVTHNMAKVESYKHKTYYVHRKGATRAFDKEKMKGTPFEHIGQPVLIPGSMGTSSYVLLGCPGSEKSFFSVNHGAGRVMSRTQAAGKKNRAAKISDKEFQNSMKGIHLICEDRRRIKEEAPSAYKDIDRVIDVVIGAGLALPVARMKPLAVLKG